MSNLLSCRSKRAVSGSRRRKRQIDPEAQARKKIFSVYTCDNHLSQLVFLMESKPPRASHNDGFLRIANCLKHCLDKAIKDVVDHSAMTVCVVYKLDNVVCANACYFIYPKHFSLLSGLLLMTYQLDVM